MCAWMISPAVIRMSRIGSTTTEVMSWICRVSVATFTAICNGDGTIRMLIR